MHTFTVSETFDGAELQISLRLDIPALARFLGKSAPPALIEELCDEELRPIRAYMAAVYEALPQLHAAGALAIGPLQIQAMQEELENAERNVSASKTKTKKSAAQRRV